MDIFFIIGVVSAILAGTWAVVCKFTGLVVFIGFFAWSSFYAVGGKKKGFKISLITNLSGAIWGFLSVQLQGLIAPYIGDTLALAISVGLSSFIMCYQARISILSFIPGSFIGASAYFASGLNLPVTLICLPIGACIGYLSEVAVNLLDNKYNKTESIPEKVETEKAS